MFKSLYIGNWRQFSEIDMEFHPRLTVLTGANGSGKTTMLNLLSQYVGWTPEFVSSFYEDSSGAYKYSNSFIELMNVQDRQMSPTRPTLPSTDKFGSLEIHYEGAITTIDLMLPVSINRGVYSPTIHRGQQTKGVFIHSYRPSFQYSPLNDIPASVSARSTIYAEYIDFHKAYMSTSYNLLIRRSGKPKSAMHLIKGTIAALALFGYGNSAVTPNQNVKELFEGYINILKTVLPPKLGFESIKVVMPEVLLCTKTGDFPIDAISGGISSIIDITWQLYMFADTTEPFVALIDEPENHLHPELQRTFMGNLIKAFPNVQFIVATHNPLIISSQKDSNVYMLDYENNKVRSTKLDYVNRAGTSNAILRDVLGVDSTIPHWAEEILDSIVSKYQNLELSNDSLGQMRSELQEIGLEDYIPTTIAKIIEVKK